MTYSIIARDPSTGEVGVAVQSHAFQVGPRVPWAQAGAGAVATQARVDVRYGPVGLRLLAYGYSASETLSALLSSDAQADVRQVAIVDAAGNVAVHTGRRCIREAGHYVGSSYATQGNMLERDDAWDAMAAAFESADGPLAERLVVALYAAENTGGDIRGKQSAALVVATGTSTGQPWRDRLIDLRVEDHPDPLGELERLLELKRIYIPHDELRAAMHHGDRPTARAAREESLAVGYRLAEIRFWAGVDYLIDGKLEQATHLLRGVVAEDARWLELLARLAAPHDLLEKEVAETITCTLATERKPEGAPTCKPES